MLQSLPPSVYFSVSYKVSFYIITCLIMTLHIHIGLLALVSYYGSAHRITCIFFQDLQKVLAIAVLST